MTLNTVLLDFGSIVAGLPRDAATFRGVAAHGIPEGIFPFIGGAAFVVGLACLLLHNVLTEAAQHSAQGDSPAAMPSEAGKVADATGCGLGGCAVILIGFGLVILVLSGVFYMRTGRFQ